MHMRVSVNPAAREDEIDNARNTTSGKGVHPVQKEQSFARRNSKKELHDLYENGDVKTKLNLLCNYPQTNKSSQIWQYTLTVLIFLSVLVHCTSSMNARYNMASSVGDESKWTGNLSDEDYDVIEAILTVIFTMEFVVRLAVSKNYCYSFKNTDEYKIVNALTDHKSVEDEIRSETPFFFDILNWVDFLAILPWFLEKMLVANEGNESSNNVQVFITISSIRLLRVLRIFKILRHFAGAKIMYRTAVTSFQPLSLTAVMLFLFFFIAASLIFIFEPCVTPDCTFEDVFNTGYFVIITLTTVGFGDQIPSNNMARFVAVITMLAGAVFLSMPIAVIGNQFENAYNDHEKELALKDPIQRKRIMAERHAVNTRNRKQRVLNTAISLTCYVCRVTEFDKKYHTGPKSPNKSVEELMQNGDNADNENANDKKKYVVDESGELRVLGKTQKYIKNYRTVLLRHINVYHSLFLVDVRELFDLAKGVQDAGNNEILRSHTLKIEAPKLQKKKTHVIIVEKTISCILMCVNTLMQEGRSKYLKAEYKNLKETKPKAQWTCKDKVWVICEVKSADKRSRRVYQCRLLMMVICVVFSFLHTMQSFNTYGETSTLCRQVVHRYCLNVNNCLNVNKNVDKCLIVNKIGSDTIKASNAGCFPNGNYKGCIKEDINDCAWGDTSSDSGWGPSYNLTCQTYHDLVDFDANKQLKADAACPVNSTFAGTAPFSDEYTLLNVKWPICARTVCISNDQQIVTSIRYAALELLLLIYFLSEFITRAVVSRKVRIFLKNNIIDILFIIIFTFEYLLVLITENEFKYTVWGMPLVQSFDPATFRPFRLMIPIRFLFMAGRIKGVDVCNETVSKVSKRMATPLLFFFIGVIIFAGPLYVAELQYSIPGMCDHSSGFPGKTSPCFRCGPRECSDGSSLTQTTCEQAGGTWIDNTYKCHVQDMFDAMWIVMVTMTSVGYGGLFPKTAIGKGIIMSAALFGAFYMAMPLTIIGSQFYKIYKKRHSKEVYETGVQKMKQGLYSLRRQTAAKDKDTATRIFMSEENDTQIEYMHPDECTEEKVEFLRQYALISEDDIKNLPVNGVNEFAQKTQHAIGILSEYLSPEEHGIKPNVEIFKTTND